MTIVAKKELRYEELNENSFSVKEKTFTKMRNEVTSRLLVLRKLPNREFHEHAEEMLELTKILEESINGLEKLYKK